MVTPPLPSSAMTSDKPDPHPAHDFASAALFMRHVGHTLITETSSMPRTSRWMLLRWIDYRERRAFTLFHLLQFARANMKRRPQTTTATAAFCRTAHGFAPCRTMKNAASVSHATIPHRPQSYTCIVRNDLTVHPSLQKEAIMCFRPPSSSTEVKTCPQCEAVVPPGMTRCVKCGADLPEPPAPGAPTAPGALKAPGAPAAPGSPSAR